MMHLGKNISLIEYNFGGSVLPRTTEKKDFGVGPEMGNTNYERSDGR